MSLIQISVCMSLIQISVSLVSFPSLFFSCHFSLTFFFRRDWQDVNNPVTDFFFSSVSFVRSFDPCNLLDKSHFPERIHLTAPCCSCHADTQSAVTRQSSCSIIATACFVEKLTLYLRPYKNTDVCYGVSALLHSGPNPSNQLHWDDPKWPHETNTVSPLIMQRSRTHCSALLPKSRNDFERHSG